MHLTKFRSTVFLAIRSMYMHVCNIHDSMHMHVCNIHDSMHMHVCNIHDSMYMHVCIIHGSMHIHVYLKFTVLYNIYAHMYGIYGCMCRHDQNYWHPQFVWEFLSLLIHSVKAKFSEILVRFHFIWQTTRDQIETKLKFLKIFLLNSCGIKGCPNVRADLAQLNNESMNEKF